MRPILQTLQPTHAMSRTTAPSALRLLAIVTFVTVAAFVTPTVTPSAAQAATLAEQRALAAELDAEVSKLERTYDALQERYRGAEFELQRVRRGVGVARVEVGQTKRDRTVAQTRLGDRAVAIYLAGGVSTSVADVAASGSFENFFDRLETVQRIGTQDANVLERVRALNERVQEKERALTASLKQQARIVARAERAKAKMGTVLDARQDKLNSVNSDIRAIMEAQRRAEQARAAAAARANAVAESGGSGPDAASDSSSGLSSSTAAGSGGGGGGMSVPLPPGSGTAAAAASAAMTRLGSPYVWAASGPNSFDCSGLVTWAFAQAGRPGLPHSTYALVNMGVAVPMDQLQVGDLVFSASNGHMGIWVGNNSFVHAPRSGDVVKVTSMNDYALSHARRI